MKVTVVFCLISYAICIPAWASNARHPIVGEDLLFEEREGKIVIEAEFFYKQTLTENRAWYLNSPAHRPMVWPDWDAASYDDAGNGAYVEVLPDLFFDDNNAIFPGENLSDGTQPMAVLHYRVHFSKPGRYYIWSRIRSNDEEDNTMAAGVDDTWPESAKTLQFKKHTMKWQWNSENRLSRTPWKIGRSCLEIPASGIHDVQFSMREDGHEFDRFILTSDEAFVQAEGIGPEVTVKEGTLPRPFTKADEKAFPEIGIRNPDGSVYGANLLYAEKDGKVAFEAENFYRQMKTDSRMWYLVSAKTLPSVGPDSDPAHLEGASDGAYLEVLPDARQKDEDAINSKTSIALPGVAAILGYKVRFATAGTYYVWVRSRGTDGDDNTLHVGIDSTWPESGQKIHVTSKDWQWICNQRDTKKKITIDIPAGTHEIMFSMREDGCELDRICLSMNPDYKPDDANPLPLQLVKGLIEDWYKIRDQRMETSRKYMEKDGVVVIEAESAPSTQGWKYFADNSGQTGYGYYEWQVEGQGIAAGKGLLKYRFEISTPGNYQLLLRGKIKDPKNRLDTLDPDGNDVWVKFIGGKDVEKQAALGDQWSKIAILGHPEGWTFNTNADQSKTHETTPACRHFEKGIYTIELSGRSQGYAIDRLVLSKFEEKPLTDFDQAAMEKSSESAAHSDKD
jgi:hypothetical protein